MKKSDFFLVRNSELRHQTVWGNEVTAPLILNLGTSWS
jgi:hypothetical protein